MPNKQHVMASGLSSLEAGATVGGVLTQPVAGSSQSNASLMALGSHYNITTSSSNQGCIFPPGTGTTDSLVAGDWGTIFNNTANSIIVYPPTGGKINGGSANAGVTMTTLQKALFVCLDGTSFTLLIV